MINSTDYFNTFIQIADDCKTSIAIVPPVNEGEKTVANYHYNMIYNSPYKYSSNEVLIEVFSQRKEFVDVATKDLKVLFFSKRQLDMRISPLPKFYGWGIHFNKKGKMALVAVDSIQYQSLTNDKTLKKIKAITNKKKIN